MLLPLHTGCRHNLSSRFLWHTIRDKRYSSHWCHFIRNTINNIILINLPYISGIYISTFDVVRTNRKHKAQALQWTTAVTLSHRPPLWDTNSALLARPFHPIRLREGWNEGRAGYYGANDREKATTRSVTTTTTGDHYEWRCVIRILVFRPNEISTQ